MSPKAALFATTIQAEPGFNWRPGIGDPTIAGWVTVVLYALASASFWAVAKSLSQRQIVSGNEVRIWHCLFLLFAALGVNKQLDLQTALTEFARILAREQGWYAERGAVQILFVAGVVLVSLIAGAAALYWAISAPLPTWVALLGAVGVVGYVTIRAASFHHMDRFIGGRVLGLRWNWVLEMGGISLAWFGAFLRARQLTRQPRPPVRVIAVQQRLKK